MSNNEERRLVEQEDSETASHFLSHAERLSELGCFDWDIQTNSVRWSDGLYRIYGLKPQEFEATFEAFVERVVPEDRAQVAAAVENAIATRGSFSSVERIVHASGEIRFLESRGEVLTAEDGSPVRLIGVCRDVTRTKNLENELRHSQKMEAVGRLAAGIAHDFNNLLTVINLNADLLLLEAGGGAHEFALAIRDAAKRASSLTSQLLMFGRQSTSNHEIVNLNDRLRGSRGLLASLLGDRSSIELNLEADLPGILIDESHLDQVLMNLAVNARDAMPSGGTLTFETKLSSETAMNDEGTADTREFVLLTVSDTGHGMTAEECNRAFEPFYSGRKRGTGLGLAVVYGVIHESGGTIEVESEQGKGTRFRIRLPSERCDTKVAQLETEAIARGEGRILYVEDESLVRAGTSLTLRQHGYEVLEAANGIEAIQIAKSFPGRIDLLFTDMVMPEISGTELADQILELIPDIAVLFTSGYSEEASAGHPRIQKPYTIQRLLKEVHLLLDGGSNADE